jgi:hypothetical protein
VRIVIYQLKGRVGGRHRYPVIHSRIMDVGVCVTTRGRSGNIRTYKWIWDGCPNRVGLSNMKTECLCAPAAVLQMSARHRRPLTWKPWPGTLNNPSQMPSHSIALPVQALRCTTGPGRSTLTRLDRLGPLAAILSDFLPAAHARFENKR